MEVQILTTLVQIIQHKKKPNLSITKSKGHPKVKAVKKRKRGSKPSYSSRKKRVTKKSKADE